MKTGVTPTFISNLKSCVSSKNGSYVLTGFPLLLKIVQPLPTHRLLVTGPPSTRGPGVNRALDWILRPRPSEYEKVSCSFRPSGGMGSLACVSRAIVPQYEGSF